MENRFWKYEFRGKTYKTARGLVKAALLDNPMAKEFFFDADGTFCAKNDKAVLRYKTVRYIDQNVTSIS
mgnify:CR=1 FL=1